MLEETGQAPNVSSLVAVAVAATCAGHDTVRIKHEMKIAILEDDLRRSQHMIGLLR